MISRDKKFIFIQVPKTAGSSMNYVLKEFSTLQDLANWKGLKGHAILSQVIKDHPEFNHYFKFAVVRNPFDWLVSYYEYKRCEFKGDLYHYICNMCFPDFVFFLKKIKQGEIKGFNQDVMNVAKGQTSWTHHNGNQVLNKIIRFEQLNEEFKVLTVDLNLGNLVLPKYNNSKRQPTYNYYDKKTKDLVVEIFQEDFNFLGYSKDFKTIKWL